MDSDQAEVETLMELRKKIGEAKKIANLIGQHKKEIIEIHYWIEGNNEDTVQLRKAQKNILKRILLKDELILKLEELLNQVLLSDTGIIDILNECIKLARKDITCREEYQEYVQNNAAIMRRMFAIQNQMLNQIKNLNKIK